MCIYTGRIKMAINTEDPSLPDDEVEFSAANAYVSAVKVI